MSNPTNAPATPSVLLTIEAATRAYSLSRSRLFELVRDGTLESVKIGKRRLLRVASIERFIADHAA